MNSWLIFFFFQAEDGIRDLTVTGVQTCPLPISNRAAKAARRASRRDDERARMRDLADARRARQVDALPPGEHLRAAAPSAQAAERRIRGEEAPADFGCDFARRGFWHGLGVSAQAGNAQHHGQESRARAQHGIGASRCGLLIRRSLNRGGPMGVKPELAFDVCWEVYRGARDVLETKRGVSALNWKDTGTYLWRPDFRPRLTEWVADFALAGEAALDGPDWASRMVMFRVYYLGLAPYENARHFLGLR